MRIAHLINPVNTGPGSDLLAAQPITFETMRRARAASRPEIPVDLLVTGYPEDRPVFPEDFTVTEDLDRSVLNTGAFQVPRKLPLLKDLLKRLYEGSTAEWLVFTNSDIAVMPGFYSGLAALIVEGYDAFVVNRRTIPSRWTKIGDIPRMQAEVGEPHKGYDCFIFSREMALEFQLGDVCVGAPWVGRVLLANLVARARRFREFRNLHLTFHLGNDKSWRNPLLRDYQDHNWKEYMKIFPDLEAGAPRFRDPLWRSYLTNAGKQRDFPEFD